MEHNHEPNKTQAIQKIEPFDLLTSFIKNYNKNPESLIRKAFNPKDERIRDISNPIRKLQDIQTAIEKACDVHYGIRTGLLSDDLIEAVIKEIATKYNSLTIQDINTAFDLYSETRNDWKNVNKKDLVAPLEKWWQKKEEILYEIKRFEIEQREEEEGQRKAQDFLIESVKIYNESADELEWKGSIFHASQIAKGLLSKHLEKDLKQNLWIKAKEQAKKELEEREELKRKRQDYLIKNPFAPDPFRICSEMIVLECIKRGVKISPEEIEQLKQ